MATLSFSLIFFFLFINGVLSKVPAKKTFKFVNQGDFSDYSSEYGARFRFIEFSGSPYNIMWYTIIPGEYYLGLRMGLNVDESPPRWVWDANRGKPVGENATFSFGSDGNLVLAESNGRTVWSSNTANKGVVGFKILPENGNIVLYDKKGNFVWQSFDYPTDTLLPGQSLRLSGPTKLVSRKSPEENKDGIYSLVVDKKGLSLYMSGIPYFNYPGVSNITFDSQPATEEKFAWDITLWTDSGGYVLAHPPYNASFTCLKLKTDGNLEAHTFYDPVDMFNWKKTFSLFSDTGILEGCKLPSKCGALGMCKDNMCVACPTAKGLLGWSESCAPPKSVSCKGGSTYYKVVGAESFITTFSDGEKRTLEGCKSKCSADCKCLGFFFWEKESKCWLAPALGTLRQVSNATHVAYIKSS